MTARSDGQDSAGQPGTAAQPGTATLLGMYATMVRIVACDERLRAMLLAGQMRGMYYSPRGQEVIPAAFGQLLRPDDYLVATYRGLHDHLAKGVPMRALWAEYMGKATGSCKGKGGPMHITHPAAGVLVTTGIVGGGLPIATGLGLSAQLRGTDQVTLVSFGDGATNIGGFHEAMNLSALWRLPVIFCCQNNQYAEHTAFVGGTSADRVSDRAAAYKMPGVTVDGNDPLAMYTVASEAVQRARSGGGPTLVEAVTFRFHGHLLSDDMAYMPAGELDRAKAADPVPAFRAWLAGHGHATEDGLAAIEAAAAAEVADAVQFALDSPVPAPGEVYADVYQEAIA
jgi:acetoin:2,6-dichlorophenolindophenol oxidoreductase subunit alpha